MQVESDITLKDIEMMKLRWTNRRRITWVAFLAMLVQTWFFLITDIPIEKIEALAPVIAWSYSAYIGIVSSYFGFATWDYIKNTKGNS